MTKNEEQTVENEESNIVSENASIFNKKKNELKAFSKNLPEQSELPVVPTTGGLFGWFDYDVKGSDLNRLTESIQEKMIQQNKVLVRTIKEFNTIYDTFSALDKEYIQGILVSLKAAQEANTKALEGIALVQDNQTEIKQIIGQVNQVIQVLKKFKENLEKIEHLPDVDMIFDVSTKMQENICKIEGKIEAHEQQLNDLVSDQTIIKQISRENKINIDTLNKEISNHIDELKSFKQFIKDAIQNLSETVEQNNSKFDEKIRLTTNEVAKNKLYIESSIQELKSRFEQQKESMEAYFNAKLSKSNEEINALSQLTEGLKKELGKTRVVAITSIGISFVLITLLLIGVL